MKKSPKKARILTERLTELWFNTGTLCNLECNGCYEAASPTNKRLEWLTKQDIVPFIEEGLDLGVKQIGITGGEPFLNPDIMSILDYSLDNLPVLILSNGTQPINKVIEKVKELSKQKKNQLRVRISIDSPDYSEHNKKRDQYEKMKFSPFDSALNTLISLDYARVPTSIAGRLPEGGNISEVKDNYYRVLRAYGLKNTNIILFPEFDPEKQTPDITSQCISKYKTKEEIDGWMCSYLRCVVKPKGEPVSVVACTVTDDDKRFYLGKTLKESLEKKVTLSHHRCYTMCFSGGACCSE